MSASALPSKLFFRIGEVASLVGVEPHVLRYWEREFRSIRPTKSAKGQRVYSRKDVENLLRVRDLLYRDGFTIAGAKKRLQRGASAQVEDGLLQDGELEGAREREPEAASAHGASEHRSDGVHLRPIGEDDAQHAPDTDAELHVEAEQDEDEIASAQPQSGPRAHFHAALDHAPLSQAALDHAPLSQAALALDGVPDPQLYDPAVRAKLTALRAEVQSFLDELETPEALAADRL